MHSSVDPRHLLMLCHTTSSDQSWYELIDWDVLQEVQAMILLQGMRMLNTCERIEEGLMERRCWSENGQELK